ncbi:acetylxylan esterase [Agromyces seonyuensis]|uniref:Acetylesterase n=1 Tax=Agromyces seonyuensis TaxID=2662446 RepID=A0A6I4NYE2_9MICO|nr:acetylxylan esterase [Agromyces seonyuensis]MWB99336.1 acetylesterase [Agromyces seonyuensis]
MTTRTSAPAFPAPYADWFPEASFDATYGFTLHDLLAVAPEPAPDGFADRWRGWYADARRVDPAAELRPLGRMGVHHVSEVAYTCADGVRLRGWIALPVSGPARAGIVHGHGYGGRTEPDFTRVPDDVAAIFPLARGLGALNVDVGAPEEREAHVLHGIADPETCILGRCAAELWTAATVLERLVGDVPLYSIGESFGGGIGMLALPWDERLVGATFIVPSFGGWTERLAVHCEGSGEYVRRHVAAHPEAREVLRWFDASTAAACSSVPVRIEAARWDAVVPPPGQFAVANGVASAASLGTGAALELHVLDAGHAEHPGIEQARAAAAAAGRAHFELSIAAARRPRRSAP